MKDKNEYLIMIQFTPSGVLVHFSKTKSKNNDVPNLFFKNFPFPLPIRHSENYLPPPALISPMHTPLLYLLCSFWTGIE